MDNNFIGNIVTVTVDRPLGSHHPTDTSKGLWLLMVKNRMPTS